MKTKIIKLEGNLFDGVEVPKDYLVLGVDCDLPNNCVYLEVVDNTDLNLVQISLSLSQLVILRNSLKAQITSKDNYFSMSHCPTKQERELLIQLDRIIDTSGYEL